MDYVIKVWGKRKMLPFCSTIEHLCKNSSTDSCLFEYFIDLFALESGTQFTASIKRFPKEFVFEVYQNYYLFSRQVSEAVDRPSFDQDICAFHSISTALRNVHLTVTTLHLTANQNANCPIKLKRQQQSVRQKAHLVTRSESISRHTVMR